MAGRHWRSGDSGTWTVHCGRTDYGGAGGGVGGAIGGLTGALIGMGIPEYEAKRYEGRVKSGGILLSVHSDSWEWTKRAKEILELTGAEDISSTSEAKADFAKSDKPMRRAS